MSLNLNVDRNWLRWLMPDNGLIENELKNKRKRASHSGLLSCKPYRLRHWLAHQTHVFWCINNGRAQQPSCTGVHIIHSHHKNANLIFGERSWRARYESVFAIALRAVFSVIANAFRALVRLSRWYCSFYCYFVDVSFAFNCVLLCSAHFFVRSCLSAARFVAQSFCERCDCVVLRLVRPLFFIEILLSLNNILNNYFRIILLPVKRDPRVHNRQHTANVASARS